MPGSVVATIQQLAHDVFTNAFVIAMRPTMALPIVVLLLAGLACLALRGRSTEAQVEVAEAEEPAIA
jgi:hypothetical protein